MRNRFSRSSRGVDSCQCGIQRYAKRWQIELFFRWIKQNLRIKIFYGTSDNAVKTQIWIALCVYVLVAILKKELHLQQSLYEILQILSVSPFEQVPLPELLTKAYDPTRNPYDCNQLSLWYLRLNATELEHIMKQTQSLTSEAREHALARVKLLKSWEGNGQWVVPLILKILGSR